MIKNYTKKPHRSTIQSLSVNPFKICTSYDQDKSSLYFNGAEKKLTELCYEDLS